MKEALCRGAPIVSPYIPLSVLRKCPPHQTDGLFLQILYPSNLFSLFLNLAHRLIGSPHTPHLVERVHVERQVIEQPFVVCHRRQREAVELYETIHELPHQLIRSMKDMRPILVHVDTLHALAIYIATQMGTLIYFKHRFPLSVSRQAKVAPKRPKPTMR